MDMIKMQPRTGKVFAARMELIGKICQAEKDLMTAGPMHRRDLQKHSNRMRAQLRQYDSYQAAVRREAG